VASNQLELLGLIYMRELRGKNWKANDEEIDTYLSKYYPETLEEWKAIFARQIYNDYQRKHKDKTISERELEKEVEVLESKKKVNKKEVAKLKRKVTTTKKQLEKASEAVKTDDADEAVKFLKKFSK